MTTIKNTYTENLRTIATHVKSGNSIITDAPTDNNGKGEAFSPTDLLATALTSCMLTIIGIAASKNGFNVDGARSEVLKIMDSNPRRVKEIKINIEFLHNNFSANEKSIIYNAAKNCPVAKSLSSDLTQTLTIKYLE